MWRRLLLVVVSLVVAGCAPPPELRHVVLVSLDAVGANHVGAYGYARDTTPHFDALAREGALFEAAYTQQPWTLSSHLTMLTGLNPAVHGASRTRAVAPESASLAEVLHEAGFATAAFTGERVWMHPRFGHGRGFDRYELGGNDARANAPAIVAWLAEQARAVERDPQHRFFLFAHFYDAHSDANTPVPYHVPGPVEDRYLPKGEVWGRSGGTALLLQLRRNGGVTERDRTFLTAYYDAGVRYVDEYGLGAVVGALRELGLLDETLLVVTADHGEEIFEHGYVLHGQPYVETAHVPLVLRGPGVPKGVRVPQLAGLVDLAPTVLSLLELPSLPHAQGLDLTPLLRGGAPVRDAVFLDGVYEDGHTWGSSVFADVAGARFAYVTSVRAHGPRGGRSFSADEPGELYALDDDGQERVDVAAERPELARDLRERLVAWYRSNELRARALAASPARAQLSPAEQDALEALGYAK